MAVSEKDLGKFKQLYPTAVETGERLSIKHVSKDQVLAYVILKFPNPPEKISGQFGSGLVLLKIENGSSESAKTPNAKVESVKTEKAKLENAKTENGKVEKVPVAAKGMFVVADGSFPWSDRVGAWALADVPASLAGAVLPQQNCASRSLNVVGTPAAITLAVSEKDLETFKQIYPTAVETGERISVKHVSKDQVLAYVILKFPNPPKKISGQFSSGLILLKIENGSGESTKTPSEKAAVEKPAALAPTAFVVPQKKSFKFIC